MSAMAQRLRPAVDEAAVRAVLATVPDPELPFLSVVDLGIVRDVAVGPGRIRVEILPTFVGCPALEMIRSSIAERLVELAPGAEGVVEVSFAEPWTSDRISQAGRRLLGEHGFAPPERLGSAGSPPAPGGVAAPIALAARVPCPHCGSRRTVMENVFGPTLCRAIHHCSDCRQPFERFKPV